jgi:hypothetical protein
MAKKKRELTTRRMPSGGQQYVRPAETGRDSPAADRLRTIREIGTRTRRNSELTVPMIDAFLDESRLASIGSRNENQTTREDFNNLMRDMRAGRRKAGGKVEAEKMSSGGMKKSMRPVPRPGTAREREEERGAVERGNRAAEREAREADSLKPLRRKAGGTVKKMQAGGEAQSRAAARADRLRRELEDRDSRPARQEAEYQEAQQRRREAGGLSRLAMIPEAVRRAQMRMGDRMLRGAEAKETAPMRRALEAADREVTDTLGRKAGGTVKKMVSGGMCRGMGKATRGGNFSRG